MVLHVPYGSRLFPFKFGSVASVIIIALLSCSVFGANGFPGNHTDRLAQLEFKAELVLLGALHLCSTTIHFRLWYGVTCGRRHHRVTVLDLHSNKLRGITSSSIENLTFLGFLNLPNSSFYSRIPEVGRLQRLQVFWFHNNLLDGLIPPEVPSFQKMSELFRLNHSDKHLGGQKVGDLSFICSLMTNSTGPEIVET
ncbi:hypothetical protein CRG98_013800 [Punica granatum]|uniref:Leucine-rich repeat-containing N-terminal plant-type domain-containing protein n=1 Tax=Punica granatum TaxID=22663 RepID=A0A2I0KDJ4_PUNGR|nr:hypothetical protein CRG98_013800 [Punica granatum]